MVPDQAMLVPVDESDPLVLFVTMILTWAASLPIAQGSKWRHVIPFLAVPIAVGVRVAADAIQGEPLTMATILRALAAGGVAVMFHVMRRSAQKATAGPVVTPDVGP